MEKDLLGFSCPRCGIDLTVPLSASGAEGPCPRCGAVIRAPKIVEPEKPPEPVRLEVPPETGGERSKPVVPIQPSAPTYVEPQPEPKPRGKGLAMLGIILSAVMGFVVVLFAIRKVRQLPDAAAKISKPPVEAAPVPSRNVVKEPAIDPALDPRVPPEGTDVTVLITKSAGVLGRFLEAESLAPRLSLIETKTPEAELAESVLAGELPVSSGFNSTEVRFNKVEGSADVVFAVPFGKGSSAGEMYLLVVRTRGTQEPKVMVDPFLDGYGGRVATFAKEPVDGEREFRVVMSVFGFCTDESVPDHQEKRTMKITSHSGGPDAAKAYFSANSSLAGRYPETKLPFGRTVGATVILRWVKGERPYIEVVDIKALNWDD